MVSSDVHFLNDVSDVVQRAIFQSKGVLRVIVVGQVLIVDRAGLAQLQHLGRTHGIVRWRKNAPPARNLLLGIENARLQPRNAVDAGIVNHLGANAHDGISLD